MACLVYPVKSMPNALCTRSTNIFTCQLLLFGFVQFVACLCRTARSLACLLLNYTDCVTGAAAAATEIGQLKALRMQCEVESWKLPRDTRHNQQKCHWDGIARQTKRERERETVRNACSCNGRRLMKFMKKSSNKKRHKAIGYVRLMEVQ